MENILLSNIDYLVVLLLNQNFPDLFFYFDLISRLISVDFFIGN